MNIYDRIVPNQAYVTLWSLAIGVALAVLMEAVSRHVISRRPPRAGRIVMNEPQYFVRRDLLGAFVVLLSACTTQPGSDLYRARDQGARSGGARLSRDRRSTDFWT
jgi:hypothetical protein